MEEQKNQIWGGVHERLLQGQLQHNYQVLSVCEQGVHAELEEIDIRFEAHAGAEQSEAEEAGISSGTVALAGNNPVERERIQPDEEPDRGEAEVEE